MSRNPLRVYGLYGRTGPNVPAVSKGLQGCPRGFLEFRRYSRGVSDDSEGFQRVSGAFRGISGAFRGVSKGFRGIPRGLIFSGKFQGQVYSRGFHERSKSFQ